MVKTAMEIARDEWRAMPKVFWLMMVGASLLKTMLYRVVK